LVGWPHDLIDGLTGRGFRVIRLDNRDVGLSSRTPGPAPTRARVVAAFVHRRLATSDYLLADMAHDSAALLNHLGIDRAHLVGASMGGMIAQQLTIDHPDRVLSLTSIMSNTGDRRRGSVSLRLLPTMAVSLTASRPTDLDEAVRLGVQGWKLISGPHFDEAEMTAMVRAAVSRSPNPLGAVRQLLAILASPDRTPQLQKVRVPTLVVHGLRDRLVQPSGGIATARAVPGSRLLMFPDMAHDLPGPRRAEIVDAIAENAARTLPVG
ncbi:MAG: alpha/beta fold hydrolase, partial [Dermatophilaceae bacterium]